MKEGFDVGDRAIHILNKDHRAERLRRLRDSGIYVEGGEEGGMVEVRSWENAHLRGGRFDQHHMIKLLEEIGAAGERQGTGITRLWANMEWALEDFPGVHDILEYESRVNDVLPKYNIATVCTYDITKFSASLVMDILRTHPQVIVGGILRENPFYVSPDEFLRELRGRNVAPHRPRRMTPS
jgi:hypothetical protein